ncbi:helix-turn-helix domain-containing protein [Nocardia vinacea]|uniref:helix-turn-helix domain-containing protein n=1 Tax=Nocardia vinacea TaxID=96468 RepID=UPI003F4D555B
MLCLRGGQTPLLGTALDTFYENGFHSTTVRDVVRRVGQTVSSLFAVHRWARRSTARACRSARLLGWCRPAMPPDRPRRSRRSGRRPRDFPAG